MNYYVICKLFCEDLTLLDYYIQPYNYLLHVRLELSQAIHEVPVVVSLVRVTDVKQALLTPFVCQLRKFVC